MKKEKWYPKSKFSLEVIKNASQCLKEIASQNSCNNIIGFFVIDINDNERWVYDTEEEFYSVFRKEHEESTYSIAIASPESSPQYTLSIRSKSQSTCVTIESPLQKDIDRVAEIFEDALPDAQIINPDECSVLDLPSYRLETTLTSCSVDRDLLEKIEEYLLHEMPVILNAKNEVTQEFSIIIRDAMGNEELKGMKFHKLSLFSDSTSSIDISYQLKDKSNIFMTVDLYFSIKRASNLKVKCYSNSARDMCQTVSNRLKLLIQCHKNLNWLYHPTMAFDFIAFMSLAITGMFTTILTIKHDKGAFVVGAFFTLICIYYIIGKHLNPYTAFDTIKNKSYAKVWNWFFYGSLTFAIFGTVFTFLRKATLGF